MDKDILNSLVCVAVMTMVMIAICRIPKPEPNPESNPEDLDSCDSCGRDIEAGKLLCRDCDQWQNGSGHD